jgi:RHS repeat-associated protein
MYSYAYDATGRLLSVSRDGGSPVETYAYDANGNRTQRSLNGGPSESSTYDSNDRMLTSGSTVVSVSVDGCVTALGDTKFNYGARMMLKGITLPSGDTIRYGYDAFNRLTSRTATAGTTQFLYGNPYNIAEVTHSRDENGVTTAYFYRPTSGIYAMKRGGVLYYISTDQVGTPRLVTDGAGNVVKRIERDSFGRLLSDSNPSFKLVFGFAGGLDEPATGIVRFGLRDYDPTTGRWLEPDPLKSDSGDGDFYAYCTNDPIGLRDPLGLEGAQLNFSAYDVIGAQGQVTITDKGIGACIGGGVGIGGGVDGTVGSEVTLPAEGMTLFAELSQSMGPVTGKIGVSIGDVFDPCSTSKLQVSARSGPLQARATIDNHMGTKLDPRFRMELPQFRGPRIDMAGGVKAEAKLGIQYCTFMLF